MEEKKYENADLRDFFLKQNKTKKLSLEMGPNEITDDSFLNVFGFNKLPNH